MEAPEVDEQLEPVEVFKGVSIASVGLPKKKEKSPLTNTAHAPEQQHCKRREEVVRRAEGLVRHQLVREEAQGHRGVEEEEREAVEGVVSFPEVGAGALCVLLVWLGLVLGMVWWMWVRR